MSRVMYFIGVSTGASAAARLFPAWAEALELDAGLVGIDLPLRSAPAAYRRAIGRLAGADAAGALVTSHKVDVFAAAEDMFAGVDRYARLCREVSCVAKRDGSLVGFAKDPVTSDRALASLLGSGYFARTGGEVLCLGGGGAGVAIIIGLLTRADPADRPARIVVTDPRPDRLGALRAAVARTGVRDVAVEYAATARGDAALAGLAACSLVINATGLGKDQPGSPLTGVARFPRRAVAWDLNYRGSLEFLRQAGRQAATGELTVADGWEYFLHGWSEHICEVFGLPWTPERFAQFKSVARPPTPP
jgi:shikimate 5-dehydrogenase